MTIEKINPAVTAIAFTNEALAYCAAKLGAMERKKVLNLLLADDFTTHQYFRFALARQISKYLAEFDPSIKSIYYFGELEAPAYLNNLSLLIHMKRKTAAFTALCEGLNVHLSKEYKNLLFPKTPKLKLFLNILVDDSDDGKNCGAAGTGLNYLSPPLKIWG